MAEWCTQRNAEASQRLNETIKQGELRIAQAREDSLQSIREISLSLSSDIVEKMTGFQPSPETLQAALARMKGGVL